MKSCQARTSDPAFLLCLLWTLDLGIFSALKLGLLLPLRPYRAAQLAEQAQVQEWVAISNSNICVFLLRETLNRFSSRMQEMTSTK